MTAPARKAVLWKLPKFETRSAPNRALSSIGRGDVADFERTAATLVLKKSGSVPAQGRAHAAASRRDATRNQAGRPPWQQGSALDSVALSSPLPNCKLRIAAHADRRDHCHVVISRKANSEFTSVNR
jgi:hypothetical protein